MRDFDCRYQSRISAEEFAGAIRDKICHHCGASASALLAQGKHLEVCGEEHGFDYERGTAVIHTIALCPECHTQHHLDARGRHDPCHVKARRSREFL